MSTQHKEPLPQSLMDSIALITTSEMHPADKMEAVLMMTTGYGLYVQAETVDPTAYAIPNAQWEQIAAELASAINGPINPSTGINALLTFMNYGPSGYVEENEGARK